MRPALTRAEESILELAEEAGIRLHVAWARELPDAYAVALDWGAETAWVVVCERRWVLHPEQRAGTVAHELAHLLTRDMDHGPAWRRAYRRIRRLAEEHEW